MRKALGIRLDERRKRNRLIRKAEHFKKIKEEVEEGKQHTLF